MPKSYTRLNATGELCKQGGKNKCNANYYASKVKYTEKSIYLNFSSFSALQAQHEVSIWSQQRPHDPPLRRGCVLRHQSCQDTGD